MVQKSKPPAAASEGKHRGEPERRGEPKRRGRPRAYEPEVALGKALDLFRKQGFAATSLDDLSEATGMNRPSLYGAFGDKRELYIKSYQRYREEARAAMVEIFRQEMPVRQRLERIFASALNIYLSGEAGPRGCFTVVTAASEAVSDPDIRAMVLDGLTELDKGFTNCFRRAKDNDELPESADPVVLAQIASATIHTIAIRSRARVSRKDLEAIVKGAIDMMLGAGSKT
jgi:TetR/AcrR family transcriptional regulator, copper-responsive repressor